MEPHPSVPTVILSRVQRRIFLGKVLPKSSSRALTRIYSVLTEISNEIPREIFPLIPSVIMLNVHPEIPRSPYRNIYQRSSCDLIWSSTEFIYQEVSPLFLCGVPPKGSSRIPLKVFLKIPPEMLSGIYHGILSRTAQWILIGFPVILIRIFEAPDPTK